MMIVRAVFFIVLVFQISCGSNSPETFFAPSEAEAETTEEDYEIVRLPALSSTFRNLGARCESFINEDGEFGPYGEIVRDTIHYIMLKYPDRKVSLLLDSDLPSRIESLDELCPNFSVFNEQEKIHFWVWVFAAISWHESKCGAEGNLVGAVNPNGLSLGLLHMPHELRFRHDYSNQSLGTGSCRESRPVRGNYLEGYPIFDEAMLDPRLNLKCGIDALITALRGFHTQECYESWDHSRARATRKCRSNIYNNYWAAFKGENLGVSSMIREHPLCFSELTDRDLTKTF